MMQNSLKLFLILAIVKQFGALPHSHVPLPRLVEPLNPSEDYTHSLVVDNDEPEQYHLYWKLVDNDEYLQFEVHCKTTGWAGFGLSPNGDMTGADIAIGWVDDITGKAHLRDTHAVSKSRPIIDPIQDLHLIDAKQVSGYTMYKFKRALKTCDAENDIEIKKETNYLIFAWNDEDPVNDVWKPHGPNNRRIVVDMLLNFKDKNENMDELIEESESGNKIEFTLKNFTAKADGTLYYCQVFEYPPTPIDLHLIRYEVLISQGNKDIFHHLILYECDNSIDFSQNPNEGHECGYVYPPPNIRKCLGSQVIAVWSVGGKLDYYFPSNAGYPIVKTDKPKYYMIEFHFDYLKIDQPRLDNSGIRLYLTPNLRKDDIGIISFGTGSEAWDLQMPPKIDDIMFTSVCYPECFDKFLPDDGIYVFSGLLHTHLAGRSVTTKLVRNDKIITNLYDNPKYDFNYQFTIDLDPIKLYKGDSLIIECHYNTMDRTNMTFWGFSTHEEMCYSFVYFYPKIPTFRSCLSTPTPKELQNFYTSLQNDGLLPDYVTSNQTNSYNYMVEISEKLKRMTGNDFSDELRKRYIEFYAKPAEHTIVCGSDEDAIYNVDKPFPKPVNAIEVVDVVCKEGVSLEATSTTKSATTTKVVIKETTSAASTVIFDRFIMLLGSLVVAFNFL